MQNEQGRVRHSDDNRILVFACLYVRGTGGMLPVARVIGSGIDA